MKELIYVTGNGLKFELAQTASRNYNIELVQRVLDIDEIQSNDPQKVARDKANKAFKLVRNSIFISDDSWSFPGLNGFPGVYMHDMVEWLSVDDFLHLTTPLTDRRVILTQTLVYQDISQQKLFSISHEGALLKEPLGSYPNQPHFSIITMPGDKGKSMAQVFPQGAGNNIIKVWKQLFAWRSKQS